MRKIVLKFFQVLDIDVFNSAVQNIVISSEISKKAKMYPPYRMVNSSLGDYSYISKNSHINFTTIGKFCSIGPNLISGWGIHPLDTISTAPMFYSTLKQNGHTLVKQNCLEETKPIFIGHDVFIGMNVTILDGVVVNNGAVIGAGAVVTKDVPAYAIVAGNPAKIIRYRFDEATIQRLLGIQWWNLNEDELKEVSQYLFDVQGYIQRKYE